MVGLTCLQAGKSCVSKAQVHVWVLPLCLPPAPHTRTLGALVYSFSSGRAGCSAPGEEEHGSILSLLPV
jgi:hypothetical protein